MSAIGTADPADPAVFLPGQMRKRREQRHNLFLDSIVIIKWSIILVGNRDKQ